MTAKEYLEQYQKAKRKIERLYWDIEELQTLAEGCSKPLDGMPHGSGLKNPTEHFILKKIDKEKELEEQIETTQNLLIEIETIINEIENPELADLLHYRYIEGLQFETDKYYIKRTKSNAIADRLGYSPRHVYRMHSEALKEVEKLLPN